MEIISEDVEKYSLDEKIEEDKLSISLEELSTITAKQPISN